MEAFVYVWTDKITNKLYVGVHKGTLDDGYICGRICSYIKKRNMDIDTTYLKLEVLKNGK